jgi:hypothetical protein
MEFTMFKEGINTQDKLPININKLCLFPDIGAWILVLSMTFHRLGQSF